jgi:geranylgeranylglycerol-phosphate geranylgeranyltransferase
MQLLSALFIIIRPLNVAIAGLSILVAASLVQPFHFTVPIAYAILSTVFITAAANVINDFFDIEIDRVNRPQRILPSGRLSPVAAKTFAIFLFACGIFFSIFINRIAALIAVATSLLLIVYSWKLKSLPLSGNLAVSLSTALAFIYAALAAEVGLAQIAPDVIHATGAWTNDWRAGIFPAVFAFLLHFGREVIKDIEDQTGDRLAHARTLPLAYGLNAAQIAATVALVLLLIVTLAPAGLAFYNKTYLWIILLGVDPIVMFAIYGLWKNPTPPRLRQISNALKADMLIGLAAIYFGQ